MKIHDILVKPKVTEKSLDGAKKGVYSFEVGRLVSKNQAKQAIESLFKVHVVSIKSSVLKGKIKRVGKRQILKKVPNVKHIKVTLKKDEHIDLFPN